MNNKTGYTLVEILVAMAILIAVVVPLFGYFSHDAQLARAKDLVTARCLLEQESALVMLDPCNIEPVKLRTINSTQWKITCEAGQTGLQRCTMRLYKRKALVSTSTFLAWCGGK